MEKKRRRRREELALIESKVFFQLHLGQREREGSMQTTMPIGLGLPFELGHFDHQEAQCQVADQFNWQPWPEAL